MEEYINNIDIQTIPAQTLAFIGDAVYNVYIRTYLSSVSTAKAGTLHKLSIKYVKIKHLIPTIRRNALETQNLKSKFLMQNLLFGA